jgi:hypothetical protein
MASSVALLAGAMAAELGRETKTRLSYNPTQI